jgi:pilus assembly protein CpaE
MSSPQTKYYNSTNSPDRLSEAVGEEMVDAQPGATQVPGPFDELTIALVGPGDELRNEMARALIGSGAVEVHAFSSYPPSLDDTPALLMEMHNVAIIELDTDPELAIDLVERAVGAAPPTATVMVYSSRADSELLLRCMRAGAREFLVPPFGTLLLTESLSRAVGRQALAETDSVTEKATAKGRLLTFIGAKGGAGVTTLACNFAVSLAQSSKQSTLLIDLDLPFGDIALNLGLNPEYSTVNALQTSARLDSNLLKSLVVAHDSGLSVLATSGKLSLHQGTPDEVNKLITVAQQTFENVVVDIGARLDLTETALFRKASAVYLVTQAGIPELRNSNRLISGFFNEPESPKLEVIINRYEDKAFSVSDSAITRALTRSPHWKVPNDFNTVRQMQINATPLALANSPVSREIGRMVKSITVDQAEPEKKKGFSLFG